MANEPDPVDALLNAALKQYSPEPRAGIEQRVMYRVRAHRHKRRAGMWALALAIPLGIAAVFLAPRPTEITEPPAPKFLAAAPAKPPDEIPVTRQRHRKSAKTKVVPFPTPTPLTPEEKALVEFVANRPKEAQDLLAQTDIKPIEIEEIQVPPLPSDGGK